jgi:hypothetical protein
VLEPIRTIVTTQHLLMMLRVSSTEYSIWKAKLSKDIIERDHPFPTQRNKDQHVPPSMLNVSGADSGAHDRVIALKHGSKDIQFRPVMPHYPIFGMCFGISAEIPTSVPGRAVQTVSVKVQVETIDHKTVEFAIETSQIAFEVNQPIASVKVIPLFPEGGLTVGMLRIGYRFVKEGISLAKRVASSSDATKDQKDQKSVCTDPKDDSLSKNQKKEDEQPMHIHLSEQQQIMANAQDVKLDALMKKITEIETLLKQLM